MPLEKSSEKTGSIGMLIFEILLLIIVVVGCSMTIYYIFFIYTNNDAAVYAAISTASIIIIAWIIWGFRSQKIYKSLTNKK